MVEDTMDYSEAGDRVGIGHESIGTTLDSVKFNGSLWQQTMLLIVTG